MPTSLSTRRLRARPSARQPLRRCCIVACAPD